MTDKNLLIVGAGIYGALAKEIAKSMGCFDNIAFIDDHAKKASDGSEVVGTFDNIASLTREYANVIVAIGKSEIRLSLLRKIEAETSCKVISLVSPAAYISPSAQIARGCIVEPMAVIHTGCALALGCFVSAGAVLNHASILGEGVHVDCNAVVSGYACVPAETKVMSGTVFEKQSES